MVAAIVRKQKNFRVKQLDNRDTCKSKQVIIFMSQGVPGIAGVRGTIGSRGPPVSEKKDARFKTLGQFSALSDVLQVCIIARVKVV